MNIIRKLSETTINRIAAGEVVERPASVVKELVENAIDAGATKIDIALEQAGKNSIIVSDNGFGISKDDLPLAIQRHTTSKLDENDIMDINSFGFRGEALPSIGSVSRMKIKSKHTDSAEAFSLDVHGGDIGSVQLVAHNNGTEVEIRDLFFATPARLKFLRSDRTEFASCVDIVKKLAMAHYNVSFSLFHNSKNVLKYHAANTNKDRIVEILGEEFTRNSAVVDASREDITIRGLVSIPTYNKATSEDQYLFINNRPVKDKVISSALKVAYQDFLARDRFPVAVIFIDINPHFVDVNVHPAKTEVRFRDVQLVRGLLIASIKDALSKESHKVSDTTGVVTLSSFVTEIPQIRESLHSAPQMNFSNNYKRPVVHTQFNPLLYTAPHMKSEEEIDVSADIKNPLGAACAQLHETYIISQTEDSIVITDQHAAHERLTYEKLKIEMAKKEMSMQKLLLPEVVTITDLKRIDALSLAKDKLSKLGLEFEIANDKEIVVYAIPQVIGDVNISQLINDITDDLLELGEDRSLSSIIEHVTETYSCHHSIRAGRKLSINEMNHLLREMEQTPFSGQCNHGRPTYIELKLKDIERLFGRS
ncbi:MAG: mismatch repair protein [Pseudomonadota bacterium]|jgi:DNA mismatch repair protein MutL